MNPEPAHRYAIYYLPQSSSLLYALGAEWLGHDPERGVALVPRLPEEISVDHWAQITASPRRYGFHATLKPPFRLVSGQSEQALCDALRKFAGDCTPFSGPPLMLAQLSGFQALILQEPLEELYQLAADCVSRFDHFRMPPDEQELAQRRHSGLTARELAHIDRWGYPYVHDTWKFHMTLTSFLPAPVSNLIYAHLENRLRPLEAEPLTVDSICLFQEPLPGGQFSLVERFLFHP